MGEQCARHREPFLYGTVPEGAGKERLPNVLIKAGYRGTGEKGTALSPGYPETLRLGPSDGPAVESRSGT